MVLGLLWPRIKLSPRLAQVTATGLSFAFWGLELRILASAFAPPADGLFMRSATVLGAISALAMVLTVGTLVLAFRPAARDGVATASRDLVGASRVAVLNDRVNG